MNAVNISIQQLKVGMYVVGLDIPWMNTPFLRNKIHLKSVDEIRKLHACGAKKITIDLDKSTKKPSLKTSEGSQKPKPKATTAPTTFKAEVESAKKIRSATQAAIKHIADLAQQGGVIQQAELTPLIHGTIDSLQRNSQALATLIQTQFKSSQLSHHAFNVMGLAIMMGRQLKYTPAQLSTLGTAALLCDIGWGKVADGLFNLGSTYTSTEYLEIRKHVDHSVACLEKSKLDADIIRIVEQHHERLDGSGYPFGLKGDEIHPMSQIISLVDHFDSRTNDYYDSLAIIPARALQEMYQSAQKQQHAPELVEQFIQLLGIYPISSAVVLNTGERGMVTQISWKTPLLPKIKIFYNHKLTPLTRPIEVDLAAQKSPAPERKVKTVIDPSIRQEDPARLLSVSTLL